MSKPDKRQEAGRDEKGRFMPGASPGRPRGSKDKGPRKTRITSRHRLALTQTAAERVQVLVSPQLERLINEVTTQALDGCRQSQALLLRLTVPPATGTVIRGASDLASIPPDMRVKVIAQRVAEGQLTVEAGEALAKLAKEEMEAGLILPLRSALRDLRRSGDVSRFVSSLQELPIGRVIESEPDNSSGGQSE
jgi:hypothetical protein